ncbi:MAG: restriction endonuclease subunit S [Hydrotalea sp. AMD]|uniref:restriction endonuclease subunit S n=1 Tax=Hydrotalea sp. AMD TaxID=2501297 RepID=UPI0009425355|nr:restriction endonuclease subunit S [Hydrotalea sp. AMD]RWZ85878.1 MAG: restriction endonuclease subunit S [Hydrotalea sp. AMD]
MSEWKEYKLSDLCELIGGGTPKTSVPEYWNGDIPWLSVTDFNTGRKYCYDAEKKITEKGLKESSTKILKKGQIIISARGTVGVISMLGRDMAFNQSNYGINAKEGLTTNDFIYYLLKDNISQFISNSYGAVFDTITKQTFEQITVSLPPLPEQTAIAEVLSSLDDKIDLLHRQNKTLEQLAETLFRQWFVEGNTSTEIIELGSLVNTINGVSYKSTELNPSTTAMVSLKSFDRNGGFRIDGFKEFTGKYKEQQTVKEGDLVVAHTDITQDAEVIGNPALVLGNPKYETMVISMDMVKVIPKIDWISIEFLYYLMRTREFKGHCEGNANGSTVLHLSKQAIPTFEFVKPNKEKAIEFTKHAKELTLKIFENHKQIRTLTQLRDTLLPKLMSGEIRLNYDFKD